MGPQLTRASPWVQLAKLALFQRKAQLLFRNRWLHGCNDPMDIGLVQGLITNGDKGGIGLQPKRGWLLYLCSPAWGQIWLDLVPGLGDPIGEGLMQCQRGMVKYLLLCNSCCQDQIWSQLELLLNSRQLWCNQPSSDWIPVLSPNLGKAMLSRGRVID